MPKSLKEKLKLNIQSDQHSRQSAKNPSIFTVASGEYVNPDIYVEGTGMRINLENIFSRLENGGKTLIKGDAGVGKSSAISRMALLWTLEEKNFEQIDYLFKINLELLLDPRWSSTSAYPTYIEENPVACLVHYSLENNVKVSTSLDQNYITIKEIVDILDNSDQTGTLLLVDGYDKIAHLMGSPSIKSNINSILSFPNVIMTARDGTVIPLISGSFDNHLVLKGLSREAIELFIKRHFEVKFEALKGAVDSFFSKEENSNKSVKDLINQLSPSLSNKYNYLIGNELNRIFEENLDIGNEDQIMRIIDNHYKSVMTAIIEFVNHNQIVQELLYTPMHAIMICEIYSDVDYQGRLSSALTLDELYKELMNKIGKNFVGGVSIYESYDNLKEFKILKQLAYHGLTNETFSGKEIAKIAEQNGSNIDKLFSLGLLKIVGSSIEEKVFKHSTKKIITDHSDSLVDKKFAFVHPSILAYLAAAASKDFLMLERGSPLAKEAAEFIAYHRDEVHYHMFLKFLAGMVSSKDSNQIAITRFWEAVSCDLHETISTGVSRLVELWMNLLPQSILNDKFDQRIPNLEKIVGIIDGIVIANFVQWAKVIESSGYLSDKILLFIEKQINSCRKERLPIGEAIDIDSINVGIECAKINPKLKAVIEVISSISNETVNIKMFKLLLSNLSALEEREIVESSIIAMLKLLMKNKIPKDEIEILQSKLELYLEDYGLASIARKALKIINQYNEGIVINESIFEMDTSISGGISGSSPSRRDHLIREDASINKWLHLSLKDFIQEIKKEQEDIKVGKYIKLLIDNLSTNDFWVQDSWENRMESILEIIGYASDITETYTFPQLKKLLVTSKQALQTHVNLVNDHSHYQWLCDNFYTLQDLAKSEYKIVMEYLFYQALSDNRISDEEKTFISKCISDLGFSITIKPHKVTNGEITCFIQYNGITYELTGNENSSQMDAIIEVAVNNENQFAELENSGVGIRKSSISLKSYSIVKKLESPEEEMMELSPDKALVSFLYLSDHNKAFPKNALILIETAHDHFGRYVVGVISVIDEKIIVDNYKKHPDDIDTIFRISILGSMKYEGNPKSKTRYFSNSFEIDLDSVDDIISKIEDYNLLISKAAQGTSKFSLTSAINAISRDKTQENPIITKIKILYNLICGFSDNVTGNWEVDLYSGNFAMHDKDIIQAIDASHLDSNQIDIKESAERSRRNEEYIKSFESKINIPLLSKIIEREALSDHSRREMELIKANPYKKAVYEETVIKINAFYVAVNAIYSEMVKNQDRGISGMTGDLLIKFSPHIPLGFVVGFIGEIFGAIDDIAANARINNFVHFAINGEEMSVISDKIARKIVSRDLGKISQRKKDLVINTLKAAGKMAQEGAAALIVQACNKFKEYVEEKMADSQEEKEDAERKLGEDHAEIISSIIVEEIFTKGYAPKLTRGDIRSKWAKLISNEREFKASVIAYKVSKALTLSIGLEDGPYEEIVNGAEDIQHNANAPAKKKGHCTIMCIHEVIYKDPEVQKAWERGDISVLRLKPINYFLEEGKGKEFLDKIESLYGVKALNNMIETGQDKEAVKLIMLEVESRGAEAVADVFYGATTQTTIKDFAEIIKYEEGNSGLYQYLWNALSDNRLSKAAIQTMKYINYVYDVLEKMLNEAMEGNKVTITMTLLESLLIFAESGQSIMMGRRPASNPFPGDDDNNGGPSGGSSGAGVFFPANDEGAEEQSVPFLIYGDLKLNNTILVELFGNDGLMDR